MSNRMIMNLVTHFLACLMLACLSISIMEVVQLFLPVWNENLLLVFCLFVSIESMYSWRIARRMSPFSLERFVFRLSEVVVILIVLKILFYINLGFKDFYHDLVTLGQSFLTTFFTPDYLLALVIVWIIWEASASFAPVLYQLDVDENILEMEIESGWLYDRTRARRTLASIILWIGLAMIIISTFVRLDWIKLSADYHPPAHSPTYVLVYFFFAMVLLSLTQYSVMRMEWGLAKIRVFPNLGLRWLLYSLISIVILAILVRLLPVHYSIDLIGVLRLLVYIALSVAAFVFSLFLIHFYLLVYLILLLAGKSPPPFTPPVQQIMPLTRASGGVPWLSLVQSIIFWAIFLAIIIYSFDIYFKSHPNLIVEIRELQIFRILSQFWIALLGLFRGIYGRLSEIKAPTNPFRRRQKTVQNSQPDWKFLNPRHFSPRQQVVFFYMALLRRAGEKGITRSPSQTPAEFANYLNSKLPDASSEITFLTSQFVEARYSRHRITQTLAQEVKQSWERVRRIFRSRKGV